MAKRSRLHVLRFTVGRKPSHYIKKYGLVQGDTLSSALCDVYYGNLVKSEIIPELGEPTEEESRVFVRAMDDFLLASTSKDTAERLVKSF